ncbi:hypothetical protein MK489_22115 [Myxococcota bacterium]|nr:hypothetical protein [Myxococcota bacterium]
MRNRKQMQPRGMGIPRHSALCAGLFALMLMASASAESPNRFHYGGQLYDDAGALLTGEVNVTVEIWDSLVGGNSLYSESHTNVPLDDGGFSIAVGEGTASDSEFSEALFASEVFLELTVDSDTLTPRHVLHPVPQALVSKQAENALLLGGQTSEEIQTSIAELGQWDRGKMPPQESTTGSWRSVPAFSAEFESGPSYKCTDAASPSFDKACKNRCEGGPHDGIPCNSTTQVSTSGHPCSCTASTDCGTGACARSGTEGTSANPYIHYVSQMHSTAAANGTSWSYMDVTTRNDCYNRGPDCRTDINSIQDPSRFSFFHQKEWGWRDADATYDQLVFEMHDNYTAPGEGSPTWRPFGAHYVWDPTIPDHAGRAWWGMQVSYDLQQEHGVFYGLSIGKLYSEAKAADLRWLGSPIAVTQHNPVIPGWEHGQIFTGKHAFTQYLAIPRQDVVGNDCSDMDWGTGFGSICLNRYGEGQDPNTYQSSTFQYFMTSANNKSQEYSLFGIPHNASQIYPKIGDIQVAEDVGGNPQIRWRSNTLLNLNDVTPTTFEGHAGKLIVVNAEETGVEFVDPNAALPSRSSSQDASLHDSIHSPDPPSPISEFGDPTASEFGPEKSRELQELRMELARLRDEIRQLRQIVTSKNPASEEVLAELATRGWKRR